MPCVGCPRPQPVEELEEGALALADAQRVDVAVVLEHLARERRGVRSADDDVRARVVALDGGRDQRHAPAVRRPAREAEDLRVERGDHLVDPRPGEGREVHHLDLMARAERLSSEGEEAVGGLEEIGVEIALEVLGGRAVPGRFPRLAGQRDLPRRGVKEGDSHRGLGFGVIVARLGRGAPSRQTERRPHHAGAVVSE